MTILVSPNRFDIETMKQNSYEIPLSDKENRHNNQQNENFVKAFDKPMISETPNRLTKCAEEKSDLITISTTELNEMVGDILRAQKTELMGQFRKWQNNVKSHVVNILQKLASQGRGIQGRYFHSDFNHRFRAHMQLEDEMIAMEEMLASLLHADTVDDQFPIYLAELNDLRQRFQEQQRLNRH